MKILFLNHEFPNAEVENSELCYWLMREYCQNLQIEIEYVTLSEDLQYHQLKMGENITIHRLPLGKKAVNINKLSNWQLLKLSWKMKDFAMELAKTNSFDLAHAFGIFPAGHAALKLHRKKKIPYCIEIQDLDANINNSWMVTNLSHKALKNATFTFSRNKKLQDFANETYKEKNTQLMMRGIDTEDCAPGFNEKIPGQFIVLCEATLVPENGVRYLLQAMKILASRYPQIRLQIVGDGPEKMSLQDLVRALEIVDRVEFIFGANEEQKLNLYQKANVFTLPAMAFSRENDLKVRGALAMGLPLVIGEAAGLEEIVLEEKNGFLIETITADDLVEKIEKLFLDAGLSHQMGKNSFELAQKLSWQNVANLYLDVYEKMKNLSKIAD